MRKITVTAHARHANGPVLHSETARDSRHATRLRMLLGRRFAGSKVSITVERIRPDGRIRV